MSIKFVHKRDKVTCPKCLNKIQSGIVSIVLKPMGENGKYPTEIIYALDHHKTSFFGKECELSGYAWK